MSVVSSRCGVACRASAARRGTGNGNVGITCGDVQSGSPSSVLPRAWTIGGPRTRGRRSPGGADALAECTCRASTAYGKQCILSKSLFTVKVVVQEREHEAGGEGAT